MLLARTERRARLALPNADLDPRSGRARLSYRRAAEVFEEASGGWTLHQLRHSALTHAAEDLVSLLIIGSAVVGGVRGGRDIGVHQEVATDRLGSLPDEVIVPDTVPVTVRIEDASLRQSVLDVARSAGPIILVLALLWLGRALLVSVRHGDPFVAANVRRLRIIGFLLAVGVPIIQYVTQLLDGALAASSTAGELGGGYTLSGTAPLAGLGVFVLAEVFAHGVRLREDIEGTV